MDEHEKRKLEEELFYLRKLIEFHNSVRDTMWKGREKELEAYMDSMLDYWNEIKAKLDKLKDDKKQ